MSVLSPLSGGALSGPAVVPPERQTRRDALFRETPAEILQRVVLGTAWSLQPKRLDRLLPLAKLTITHLFEPDDTLPDLTKTPGAGELVGIADDLSVARLAEAYARGLFPHAHFGPTKWLSPPERCVLFFDEFHISKRLRRLMRQGGYTVTFDRDFEGVIKACAGKREGHWHLTWITPRIMRAYAALFDAGLVHSFEVWNRDGALVGGGYGVAIGRVFFTESQFSHEDNTSKLGFSVLNWHLAHWGYVLNDGKWATPTILGMGFRMIPRSAFLDILGKDAREGGKPGPWTVEVGPEVVADWHPGHSGAFKRHEPRGSKEAAVLSQVSRSLVTSGLYSKPAALALLAKHFVGFGPRLPDPEKALRHPEGLAGRCTDLSVPTLIAAYAKGLYPETKKWWAPAERMVSFPENANVSKRVWRLLQTRTYGVSFDEDFAAVVRACVPEPKLAEAFTALHEAGYAHSVEVWDRSGRLAGGLYGLAIGQAFFTEKMFSRERDAANVGFVTLSCHLQHWGFALNDGKRMSGQLSQLGFMLVPRFAFNGLLSKATHEPTRVGKWSVETGLDAARWNPKVAGTGRTTPGAKNAFTLSS